MYKKLSFITLLVVALGQSALVWAAREERTFEVSVTIPTQAFYVVPSDPGWIHREQRLKWNLATSRLEGLRKDFDVRHEAGSIAARLESPAYLSNGLASNDIALRVLFNGKELSHLEPAPEVVSAADAKAGKRVLLEIMPLLPAGGEYKAGNYFGNVNLVFNAVLPDA
ncbi:CS1 type fimbrial major subunit [Pseudomonas sp.]|uniref:CS1 type fimbrial major subunit n=1 Tax=Pseudomonas sp. TaxID=306 RepID=UPI002E2F2706|nr:CS1 type fimbrial major subunit [Pseudomonas sp.]HEX4551839.1 CS1 type fimbrial major subunit [Pseudomonas sp.]